MLDFFKKNSQSFRFFFSLFLLFPPRHLGTHGGLSDLFQQWREGSVPIYIQVLGLPQVLCLYGGVLWLPLLWV